MKRRFTVQKYICKAEHVSEILVEDAKRMKTQKCLRCGKKAEHDFIVSSREHIAATVVYERIVDGKVERLFVDPQAPESIGFAKTQGYERREIQGMAQMRKFEKEITREMKADYDRMAYGEAKQREEFFKKYHSDLRSLMSRSDIDPFTRGIMQAAIDDYNSGFSREPDFAFRNAAYS